MAVMFTTEERQAVMSLFRQFSYPNYDDNCRAEEAWLKKPENLRALASFRAKFLSADALSPDAVKGLGAAPAAPAVVVKAQQPAASADSPQSTVVKLNDGASAPSPGNAALTPQGATGAAASETKDASVTPPEAVPSVTDPKGDAEPKPDPTPEKKPVMGKKK